LATTGSERGTEPFVAKMEEEGRTGRRPGKAPPFYWLPG